jgi:tetratricopeptide (TPR) repeat protein
MLDAKYEMQLPNKVAWLGENLLHASFFKKGKQIPLFRDHNNIQDYIDENLFVSNAKVFKIDNNLELVKTEDEDKIRTAKNSFKEFKAINKYVTTNNKILPQSEALYAKVTNDFSKAELVWVQSVFNGNNFDNAYETARQLAIDKDWDRALLLSNYILTKIPRHADTEVLKGRIHSWKKDYDTSITVLNEAIRKYPSYPDAYSALLDSYYWANKSDEAQILFRTMTQYNISSPEIDEKLLRAKKQIREKALDKAAKEGNRKPNPAIIANK